MSSLPLNQLSMYEIQIINFIVVIAILFTLINRDILNALYQRRWSHTALGHGAINLTELDQSPAPDNLRLQTINFPKSSGGKPLIEELQQANIELRLLYEVSSAAIHSHNPAEALDSTLNAAMKSLSAGFGSSFLFKHLDQPPLHISRNLTDQTLHDFNQVSDVPNEAIRQSLESGRIYMIRQAPSRSECTWHPFAPESAYCVVFIPLISDERLLGAMCLASAQAGPIISCSPSTLVTLGNQIGNAVAHAWLFQEYVRSESKYRNLYDSVPDLYLTVDPDGTIVGINQTAVEQLGYQSASELIGTNGISLLPSIEMRRITNLFTDVVFENRQAELIETELVRKNGTTFPINVNYSLDRDASGIVTSVHLIARNIQKQRELELQLQRWKTAGDFSDLAGGVVHDFNNYLNSILGFYELAHPHLDTQSKAYGYLQRIEQSAQQASHLTRRLISYYRGTTVRHNRFSINEVAASALDMISPSLGEKITVVRRFAEGLPAITGDRAQIQQALVNLIINAYDAMPEGGILTVATYETDIEGLDLPPEACSGHYVCVKISDTGIGIPSEIRDRIFEPFFTTKTISKSGSGTGLGLSIVSSAVQAHHGFVTVSCVQAQGTCFTVSLLVHKTSHPKKSKPDQSRLNSPLNILLADDDETCRTLIKEVLVPLGHQVTIAADGGEALCAYQSSDALFDLVILDLRMPNRNGTETLRAILDLKPDQAYLFVTGYTDQLTMSQIHPHSPLLNKPFSREELLAAIVQALD